VVVIGQPRYQPLRASSLLRCSQLPGCVEFLQGQAGLSPHRGFLVVQAGCNRIESRDVTVKTKSVNSPDALVFIGVDDSPHL